MWNNKYKEQNSSMEITDALHELVSQAQTPDIFSREKMHSMEKDDARKEQEICILEKDDTRKEQEHDVNQQQQ